MALFIYTSGTTGKPKGVRLSHANIAANVSGFQEVVPIDGTHRSLAFLPWAHVYGGSIELHGMISIGASLAICEKRERILEYLGEVKPTVLFAVPQIWNRIYAGVQANVAEKPKLIQSIFHAGLRSRSKQKRGQSRSFGEMRRAACSPSSSSSARSSSASAASCSSPAPAPPRCRPTSPSSSTTSASTSTKATA